MVITFVPRVEKGIFTERIEVFFDDLFLAVVHVEEFYTNKNDNSDRGVIYRALSKGETVKRELVEVKDATKET